MIPLSIQTVIKWQLVMAGAAMFLALVAILTGLHLKGWLAIFPKRLALKLHRISSWMTLVLYLSISFLCLRFHFPLSDPGQALGYGWFIIHPVNGALGVFLYTGKFWTVRSLKRGWMLPGFLWGSALFLFWLVQFSTVIPSY